MSELGISLALTAALAANIAFLCKHRGATAAPTVDVRHPLQTATALFRSPWWAIGFAIATGGWALYLVALSLAPLSLVQAVMAGGLVLLSYPAERWFGCRLGRREWIGLGLAGFGLAFLAITVPAGGDGSGYSTPGMIAFEAGAVAIGMVLVLGAHRGERHANRGALHAHRGALLGAAAGLLTGVANVAIKALVDTVPADPLALLSPWTLVAVLAGIGAFYAVARSLQVGEAVGTIAVTSVGANCAAILGGVLVFGDPVGADVVEGLARGAAFAMVIAAAALMPAPLRASGARA